MAEMVLGVTLEVTPIPAITSRMPLTAFMALPDVVIIVERETAIVERKRLMTIRRLATLVGVL